MLPFSVARRHSRTVLPQFDLLQSEEFLVQAASKILQRVKYDCGGLGTPRCEASFHPELPRTYTRASPGIPGAAPRAGLGRVQRERRLNPVHDVLDLVQGPSRSRLHRSEAR